MQDSGRLDQRQRRLVEVIEHPQGGNCCETLGAERQPGGVGLHRRSWRTAYVVSTINNDRATALPSQRLRQRAVAATKIEDRAGSDLGKPLGHPITHVTDHGKVLRRELVGCEPLRIVIEVSGQRQAFQLPGLIVLVGRPTRLDHLPSPYTVAPMRTVLFKLALSCRRAAVDDIASSRESRQAFRTGARTPLRRSI